MKTNPLKKTPSSAEPLSPIHAQAYAALSKEEKQKYRAVDPKYERLPKVCFVLYGFALISLIIYIIASVSPTFADFFNEHISSVGRSVLNLLTSPIPFSLGEACIWLLPVFLVLSLIYAIRRRCDTWKSALVYLGILMSILSLLFSLFVVNFAAGYRGTSLDQKLGLDRQKVSAEELYETADLLRQHINRETAQISYLEDGFSLMPYSLDTLNHKLNQAYTEFSESHDFIHHVNGKFKPVMVSEAMSYMHITGVYSFFTGEANINVNFPDYTLPFTAAHEMAHQRGIAREDEANFVAYLVCISSEDAYIRYSGYLNMYEYVIGALASADYDSFRKVNANLNTEVKSEISAYNAFFKTYANSTASKVSGTVNNSYLQSQGTPGTKSYGMVVDLAVAYYRDEITPNG